MSLIKNFHYRPEIDGLRAIAVLAVVFFHAGLGFPGGFVGVDVFFVISGFLITSLILKDLQSGKFSMLDFWERRARRILPAAVVVVLAVLVAGWVLLLPSDYANLGKSSAWQSIFGANFYFWRNTNYFAGPADEQPLLHTWSLAVEEQFYLFIPLLLLGLFRIPAFRRRGVLLALFAFGFLISLVISIVAVPRMPAAAFYLLPARAWELLSGSIIAILPAASLSRHWREALTWLALVLILVPCFLYSKETPFPGLAALPPCLGAALFIWASSHGASVGHALPFVARALALRPIVFIGLISYSLYLWHWPLFAFSHYWALEPLSLGQRLAIVIAGFVLGVFSWRFVETPFRKRKLGTQRRTMFAYAGGGLITSCLLALLITLQAGYPTRFSKTVMAFDAAKKEALHDNRITKPVELKDALEGGFPRLGTNESSPIRLMVWGDSHARSILPAADRLARDSEVSVLAVWHSSAPPVLGYIPGRRYAGFSLGKDSPAFSQAVLNYVRENRIPSVLLAARWSGYFLAESDPNLGVRRGTFAKALIETVKELRAAGCSTWVLMEVPNHRIAVPKALVQREIWGTDISSYAATPESLQARNQEMASLMPALEAAGAKIIDVSSQLMDSRSGHYRMDSDGEALYYDNHHLTRAGALFVRKSIAPALLDKASQPSSISPSGALSR